MEQGLADSRGQAQRLIMAGAVRAGEVLVDKPGTKLEESIQLTVSTGERYVGRGGLKLEAALDHFSVNPEGMNCLDLGASTGGFTDCLLQHGAAHVVALDVGHGQLHWRLRQDPRVYCIEKYNARYLRSEHLPQHLLPFSLLVIDVSFISLTLILEPALPLLCSGGHAIVLIKPQFEAGREQVGRGGIVRDPEVHQAVINNVAAFVAEHTAANWLGYMNSPISGADGNIEFLACLQMPQSEL